MNKQPIELWLLTQAEVAKQSEHVPNYGNDFALRLEEAAHRIKELNDITDAVGIAANKCGLDSIAAVIEWLPALMKAYDELENLKKNGLPQGSAPTAESSALPSGETKDRIGRPSTLGITAKAGSKEYHRQYYALRRDKMIKRVKDYQHANKDKVQATQKEWRDRRRRELEELANSAKKEEFPGGDNTSPSSSPNEPSMPPIDDTPIATWGGSRADEQELPTFNPDEHLNGEDNG